MTLPVITPKVPLASNGTKLVNGKLGPCDLTSVFLPGLGLGALQPQAKRAWDIMATVCHAETAVQLTASSLGDTYRSYASQEQVFKERYRSPFVSGECTLTDSRTWMEKRWYRLKNVVPVATPGTSNHGWGIAIDVAEWNGRSIVGITASKAWPWLKANAVSFGFSWEWSSETKEPWHIRHLHGNDVSQRVKDVEAWLANLA